jgi:acyl-CoA synthetase (AMP-forming)/AMP-acid ligase II/thioesterase domain-containing protein/acyl carrier protein
MEFGTAVSSFYAALERQALRDPTAPALVSADREALTYGAWLALAQRVREDLRDAGYGATDRLALVVPNGPVAAAATVALGGVAALCPHSPASKATELERSFAELGVTGVVVGQESAPAARRAAQALGLPVIELIVERDRPAGSFELRCEPRGGRVSDVGAEPKIAFLARTSGTTGSPKVVTVYGRHIIAAAAACAEAFALERGDRCLLSQSVFHSAAHVRIGAVLLSGSSIVCLEDFGIEAILAALDVPGHTWLSAPPATYREMLEYLPHHRGRMRSAGLRFLRVGSAALQPEVASVVEDAFGAPLLQSYGMTEAPFISSNPLPPAPRKLDSVGVPYGCEVAILDDAGEAVGPQVAGEVVVRGPNVTADGWFRTGDVGRFDEDGYLYLLGRRKELINRGGQKIFPNEIEEVLRADDAVAEAAAFAAPHPTLGEEVAAAVILRPNAARTESELRRFTAEHLADVKVPKRIFFLSEFPRTPTGKVQRHKLQGLLTHERPGDVRADGSAVTLLEAQLVEIFAEVLGLEGIRVDDDFFLCGGDSLRAARLIAGIRTRCGEDVSLESLFSAPTPRALARRIAAALPRTATPLIRVQTGSKAVPLFFLTGDLDGGSVYMRHLARELDRERTVYALPPHGTNGIPWRETIEAMALEYAAVIQTAFPQGPYLIGGYCNGGVVAYEIARLLRARGFEVGPLLLIAATAANGPFTVLRSIVRSLGRILRWSQEREHRWYRRLRERAVTVASLNGASISAYGSFLLEQGCRIMRRFGWLEPLKEPTQIERSDAYKRMGAAMERYFPKRYDGELHHFWAYDDAPILAGDPTMGWGSVVSNLTMHRVRGDHLTIVTREFAEVARLARPLLERYG